jgi:hypothetical protein
MTESKSKFGVGFWVAMVVVAGSVAFLAIVAAPKVISGEWRVVP